MGTKLTLISRGALQQKVFTDEIRNYATRLVSGVIASDANYHHDNMTRTPCPQCGKFMLEINGKHGKMLVCPDRECGYRQNLSYLSNARCPNCHKKLEVFGEGDKKIYICHTCGFREKFDSFNKHLSEGTVALPKLKFASTLIPSGTSRRQCPLLRRHGQRQPVTRLVQRMAEK